MPMHDPAEVEAPYWETVFFDPSAPRRRATAWSCWWARSWWWR